MMKRTPVTLVNEKGERHTFESASKAKDFLGVKNQCTITEMKHNPNKTVEADGHQWHIEDSEVARPVSVNHNRTKKSTGIIAIRNLGSRDPKHPEETINFSSVAEAAKHFGKTETWVLNHMSGDSTTMKDRWFFRRVESKEVRKLLQRIQNDDGIINLDDDDPWGDGIW